LLVTGFGGLVDLGPPFFFCLGARVDEGGADDNIFSLLSFIEFQNICRENKKKWWWCFLQE
jgi:hypothetical protein